MAFAGNSNKLLINKYEHLSVYYYLRRLSSGDPQLYTVYNQLWDLAIGRVLPAVACEEI